ncbi:MAG: methyltransferase domain-containing protein [Myxococcota bacterium]
MRRTLEPEAMDDAEEVAAYATMDHSEANLAFVERLLALRATGHLLDIGTGPGEIPLLICERLESVRVTGVDLSRQMLRHAQRLCGASPRAARVALRRADAKRLPFRDACFDAVASNTILHHLPDPLPFLREARRVLRPGGALLIRDLLRPDSPQRADELVALHARDATPEQRELLRASLHAALTADELRALANAAGLAEAELRIDSDRHLSLQIGAR